MILKKYTKQPNEVKDYDIDYLPWLTPIGDTLDDVTATVENVDDPLDTTFVVDSTAITESTLKIWVSGGTAGNAYKVTLVVNSTGGRIDESELIFIVKDF